MVAWMVAPISQWLLGTMEMCGPRALKMTPKRMASDLKKPRHNFGTLLLRQMLPFQITPVPNLHLPDTYICMRAVSMSTLCVTLAHLRTRMSKHTPARTPSHRYACVRGVYSTRSARVAQRCPSPPHTRGGDLPGACLPTTGHILHDQSQSAHHRSQSRRSVSRGGPTQRGHAAMHGSAHIDGCTRCAVGYALVMGQCSTSKNTRSNSRAHSSSRSNSCSDRGAHCALASVAALASGGCFRGP